MKLQIEKYKHNVKISSYLELHYDKEIKEKDFHSFWASYA